MVTKYGGRSCRRAARRHLYHRSRMNDDAKVLQVCSLVPPDLAVAAEDANAGGQNLHGAQVHDVQPADMHDSAFGGQAQAG